MAARIVTAVTATPATVYQLIPYYADLVYLFNLWTYSDLTC